MMLPLVGLITILAVLLAILSKRVSPLVALIVFPILASLATGFGLETSRFILSGIQGIAGVIGMFVFAILFFGVLTDARMLEPVVAWLLSKIGSRPSRIVPGTALLALLVHLDGSGAVVFLVTIPALLPLYRQVGIDRRILACVASLAAGVNFLPWTGPTLRASAALHIPTSNLFLPLLGVQAVGLGFVFLAALYLGIREEKRLAGVLTLPSDLMDEAAEIERSTTALPRHFYLNLLLLVVVLGVMISGKVDPVVLFMLGTVIALLLNFPSLKAQQERLVAHAPTALLMASILFAAGSFTGIMRGTGMLNAMAGAAVHHLPQYVAGHIPILLAIISMPLSLLFDPDSFYFGVLPVIAGAAAPFGVAPITVAQAALMGVHTVGFPVSPLTPATFLAVGLSDISLVQHQRFATPFLWAASLVMTAACLVFGIFHF
ncbi:MAG TPA: citrate:proton symporter [Acidobacteriaceae bacterium]|nr:citrate:proton symporter [Acidobacteriaceae bacterium]